MHSLLVMLLSTSCFCSKCLSASFLLCVCVTVSVSVNPGVAGEVRPLACSHRVRAALSSGGRHSRVMPPSSFLLDKLRVKCWMKMSEVRSRNNSLSWQMRFFLILKHYTYSFGNPLWAVGTCAVAERFATINNGFPDEFYLIWFTWQPKECPEISHLCCLFFSYIISSSYWLILSFLTSDSWLPPCPVYPQRSITHLLITSLLT